MQVKTVTDKKYDYTVLMTCQDDDSEWRDYACMCSVSGGLQNAIEHAELEFRFAMKNDPIIENCEEVAIRVVAVLPGHAEFLMIGDCFMPT